jgi:sterol desaturase/sphingolipid hydroxylase (fatty acid hydroxylase superfamily)
MHRWHHAADDPDAINKNFCIVFAWIDLLFGTFYVPKNRLPTRYGVVDAHGNDVAGYTFLDQMLYPFRHHARWIRDRLARYDNTPDEALPKP